MSALFDNSYLKTLTATIGSPPASSANKLLVAWVKWDSAYDENSTNVAAQLAGTSGASPGHRVRVQRISTSAQGNAAYGGAGAAGTISGFTEDAWHLVAMYIPGNDGTTAVYGHAYYDSATPTASATSAVASATAQDFQYLTIGQGDTQSSFTHWKGRVAEVAIFSPADLTESNAIIAELLTTRADSITTKAPIWYAPLESDATLAIGTGAITNNNTVTFSDADHPSLSGGTPSATITLTPDPASVQVGGTRTFTATRSAPAGAGGVTYNVASDNPAVATVPTPQSLTEADSDLTFDATGVSVGTANITITNAADSGETDTVALTVTVVTTKKCKFLVHPDFASATGITIEVNEAPTGGALTGAKLGFTTGVAAEATLEAGQAVIKPNAADVGASALAAGTSVRAIFKGLAASGSALGSGAEAGSVVVATGTIIEE